MWQAMYVWFLCADRRQTGEAQCLDKESSPLLGRMPGLVTYFGKMLQSEEGLGSRLLPSVQHFCEKCGEGAGQPEIAP